MGAITSVVSAFHQLTQTCIDDPRERETTEKFLNGKVGTALSNVDFFLGLTVLVVGILSILGQIPCCEGLAWGLIGAASVNILASFLRTFQQDASLLSGCCPKKTAEPSLISSQPPEANEPQHQ
jgi:hypothetical protein